MLCLFGVSFALPTEHKRERVFERTAALLVHTHTHHTDEDVRARLHTYKTEREREREREQQQQITRRKE